MEVDSNRILQSCRRLREQLGCYQMDPFLRLTKITSTAMDELVLVLGQLIEDPVYTVEIGREFGSMLLLIVANALGGSEIRSSDDQTLRQEYLRKCVALSKLITECPSVLRFSIHFFRHNPPPFGAQESVAYVPKSKVKKITKQPVSDLEIVQSCYRFLLADISYFRSAWKWSEFFELFDGKGCNRQRYYYNRIVAMVCGMNQSQLNHLDRNLPVELLVSEQMQHNLTTVERRDQDDCGEKISWSFSSRVVTNVGDVILPIFDSDNSELYRALDDELVIVDSTRLNVRSLALGVSSGKAICLSGPVGCGKTSLVEFLARKTGRVGPKMHDFNRRSLKSMKAPNQKRKSNGKAEEVFDVSMNKGVSRNGFLRVQLGDQTDSKMMLGQYRCTDTPGEFVWQPGVLTQAVMNGYWLLLEDLDSATQDVCTVLTNLLENNYLSVPGFRDCLRIEPGFQLFLTLRTQKTGSGATHSPYSLLEKYLYTVNVVPLSRPELCSIICTNFPKLKTVASRIVDIYLTFSSGNHVIGNEEIEDAVRILENKCTTNGQNVAVDWDDYLPRFKYDDLSLTNLPNSGRLVSTRDLIKLCRRSVQSFSVTSTECAYFVFQNAVDLFCSHLPAGDLKRNLVVSIGGKIGINKSRCEHLCDDYKPEVDVNASKEIRIGRVPLKRNCENTREKENETFQHKKLRLDENASSKVKLQGFKMQSQAPTFSFTRPASCLLERIAVSVAQNEPTLLVGETGVGKTSAIQYLAYQTRHKLVVVNMNNQSDVSDLIGGFKPVDLSYVVTPLRYEFEFLFARTFNAQKNEKFLSNVSVCYNRGEYNVLVKLMLKIADKAFVRCSTSESEDEIQEKWARLQRKLRRLDAQLTNSVNVSFAFIPGSLVNCIRDGAWVLLDEINLASTETLECLSTILEPDGSIVLLERGDFVPVKRHPDFRIFACMNPSTDVGKKDLPVGIRNRFTEFFVDELVAENDLLILVNDYLGSSGIQKNRILNTVKLYRRLRALSQLELNDGLGNKPVYSLRTLCRALSICGKNLCGSIERNLYESFCLSFLTQLDLKSHQTVLSFIQKTLLNDVHQATSHQIPKPTVGEQLNFEGYWIEKGPKEIQQCEKYILTDSVRSNLRDLARIISIGKLPVLLQGPTSAGKTSLIEYIAKRSGNVCLRINNHEHTDLQEYIGTYVADVSGKLSFKEGVLVEAMRQGYWIILDELNLAPSDILEALNRVLDDNRELFIPETQVVVKAHPNFMLFATQNPPGLYGGRKMLSRAFKNRFIELHFSDIPRDELQVILEKRCLIPKSYSQKMVKVMSELQMNRHSTSKQNFTLRDLFRWGNRYTYADSRLLDDTSYDWNQHLIDEGYLVLSSKVRNLFEIQIIEQALFTHFRKHVSEQKLFTLSKETSRVTRGILEQLEQQTVFDGIVWTFDMRRMAVLTAKALEFNEPVLLVGPTGCGKTTICQILAATRGKTLRILNCHMHTEGADFLGGLRPFREADSTNKDSNQLFEWSDGPLVLSMMEGGFFLADEISLAEDSVLERLNCVLEPERTLLLAEKGGVSADACEFVITAADGFQFLATMNPGGDFGKKELSPALRNRLTEIWCRATDCREDLVRIAEHTLRKSIPTDTGDNLNHVAQVLIGVVFILKKKVDKLNFSIRDVLAWVAFIAKNHTNLSLAESLIYGLETVFLDALEMLPYETFEEILTIRSEVITALKQLANNLLDIKEFSFQRGTDVQSTESHLGIKPFFIPLNPDQRDRHTEFLFSAPTTQQNLFRLLSALSLDKAILLEGPPGVGKTSLVENLARAAGYAIVRINLCEHTDLADLFGTDLPAEDHSLEIVPTRETKEDDRKAKKLGSFVWRDGPLLAALKARNTWVLLDELNLAPQSVLEGLNAILDHRGEVFIAELNKTFKLGQQTRIFAAQNPLHQGGGRKGLPQSFLNRFTKVYLRKLERSDLLAVVNGKYRKKFARMGERLIEDLGRQPGDDVSYFVSLDSPEAHAVRFDLCERMVQFSEILETGISNLEFGYKGGPFEANLRDILRWCELLCSERVGFLPKRMTSGPASLQRFLLVLFEKMKLVYYQRMRTDVDKKYILTAFARVFSCDAFELEQRSQDISVYWTDEKLYLGDLVIEKSKQPSDDSNHIPLLVTTASPLLLSSQIESLKCVAECSQLEKPVILCGPSDCGKTKIIQLLTTLSDQFCNVDTIDDSVTGSFQQLDFNRHLEEISSGVEPILMDAVNEAMLEGGVTGRKVLVNLFGVWERYARLNDGKLAFTSQNVQSEELILFRERLAALQEVITVLTNHHETIQRYPRLRSMGTVLSVLLRVSQQAESLNTGGYFEWVDSKVVKSLKQGQYICLEHVNLCSSAILDRLNPIFEPDGSLLISEKGVDGNNESEIIRKHANFRAFLTLDPKHGEISRAMRNRCIELALHKEGYSDDDLRKLVFENGVHDGWLISVILAVHRGVRKVSEFNQFGIAHVLKFAYLVAQNQRIGIPVQKSLMISALEVYVRSSNTDLLGYGLEYYRTALKSATEEEVGRAIVRANLVNFSHIVLRSNRLTQLQLIKLQSEPLLCMLRCHMVGVADIGGTLANIATAFGELEEVSLGNLKYCLYLLYGMSSFQDVEHRKIFLAESLKEVQNMGMYQKCKNEDAACTQDVVVVDFELKSNNANQWSASTENFSDYRDLKHLKQERVEVGQRKSTTIEHVLQHLLELNSLLFGTIKKFKNCEEHLPWDHSVFSAIREYQQETGADQYRINAILLLDTTLEPIEVKQSIKLSQIDVLSYSKAANLKMINDSVGSPLIMQLYDFLVNFRPLVEEALQAQASLDCTAYVKLIGSYLWINRLINLSRQKLFVGKEVNSTLVDYITLHINWVQKHCLAAFEGHSCERFKALTLSLDESVQKSSHPLAHNRKLYSKTFLNFLPLYSQEQVTHHQALVDFNEGLRLIPRLTRLYDYEEFRRRIALLNHSRTIDVRRSLLVRPAPVPLLMIEKRDIHPPIDNEKLKKLFMLVQDLQPAEIQPGEDQIALEICRLQDYQKFVAGFNFEGDYSEKFEVEMLPLYEYFLVKVLAGDSLVNHDYVVAVRSLNLDVLELLRQRNDLQHRRVAEVITGFNELIAASGDSEVDEVLKVLPPGAYSSLTSYYKRWKRQVYKFKLNSLAVDNSVCYKNDTETDYEACCERMSSPSFHGAVLTTNILSVVLDNSGELRSTGLGELPEWRRMLRLMRDVMWGNSAMMRSELDGQSVELRKALEDANKLLFEISTVRKWCAANSHETFVQDFNKLIEELQNVVLQAADVRATADKSYLLSCTGKNLQWRLASLIRSLYGAIELNIMVHLPLLDPVEKNALKKAYTDEDIDHYRTLVRVYDYMAVTMNYQRLGEFTKRSFTDHLNTLDAKRQKLSRKVALRPDNNIYTDLVKDINNFLISCCHPATIVELVKTATQCLEFEVDVKNPIKNCTQTKNFQLRVIETIKQLELWMNTAEKFEHHTLKRYGAYYQDFLEPVLCAITSLKYGLSGLRHSLLIRRDSIEVKSNGVFYDLSDRDALTKLVQKFTQFPMVDPIELFDEESAGHKVSVYSLLEKLDHSEANYFRLLKSKLQEIKNGITLRGCIGEEEFVQVDKIVNVWNQVWQKQELLRRKKQAEEDSLYQSKSHCDEESEEVLAEREIGDMFPNYVDEDFADFIQNDTLEQVIKMNNDVKNRKPVDTITGEDYALISESFIYLMNKFSRSYYYNPHTMSDLPETIEPDFVTPFRIKIAIFQQLMRRYGLVLNSALDESFYPGLSLLIGLLQEKYDDHDLQCSPAVKYNFYKDSNITEVVQCVEVLKKVEHRVRALLQEWPDHAGLKDIVRILDRIYGLPSTAPIVRFSTGLQLLRQKIDEWNSVAHRMNNLRELEAEIVTFVHRWMRMELQFWRDCMGQTYDNVRRKACRYWFFMYNLLHEFLQSDSKAKLGNLLDYRKVERYFGEDELLEEEPAVEEGSVQIGDLIQVLKQFMESSNYAEFSTRLRLLKSFEQYLIYLNYDDNRKKDMIVAVLNNLHLYYDQFSAEIEDYIKSKRTPIEKKLKEFVKIESFNKDLSYFSMRNNIARVHRQLHKFLKEFETTIKEKILPIFSPKDAAKEINDAEEQKLKNLRSEPKITYYMVDVKNFMASSKLKEKFSVAMLPIEEKTSNQELFRKIDRFFVTSRSVVKQAILHGPFPGLIYNLDTFLHDHIETIEYLRALEVNREQPRPKQKSQAKQILNQKRKALADFYRSLTQLGLSYRSGLVESAIESDPVDLTIKPFSVELLTQNAKYRKVDQHLVFLNDKLNLYYSKCVFKIKLLMKVMLQPNPDVGLMNIDRIKGFAVDLFLLVQNQRKELSQSIASVSQLRDRIQDLTNLSCCVESSVQVFSFEQTRHQFQSIKYCLTEVRSVLEQFNLLLKCVPAETREELKVLPNETGMDLKTITPISKLLQDCLNLANKLKDELSKIDETYIAGDVVAHVSTQFETICSTLEALIDKLKLENSNDESIYAQPINRLLSIIRKANESTSTHPQVTEQNPPDIAQNVNNELENIIHSVLLAMQHIYKKYSTAEREDVKAEDHDQDQENSNSSLQPQHLKQKINHSLGEDLQTLSLRKVTAKLAGLLSILENVHDPAVSKSIIQKLIRLVPILEQYNLLVEYYLIQQLGAHKISTKMLSVMLTVFIELGTKGFCVPKDLLEDEQDAEGDQQQEEGQQNGEKFGFEDGEGEKDVSNKIESEDQLDDAKKPGQEKDSEQEEEKDNKEEKGIDMSEDFESKLQDIEKPEGDDSEDENEDEEEEVDKQMGETEDGAEKLDDQIWGDDETKEDEKDEDEMEEEDGKGSGETDEQHNNLDSEKEKAPGQDEEGLDAIDQAKDDRKKDKPKDIEDMNNQDGEEEQENPFHNQLEEPPQPEDLDLDEEFNLDNDNRPDNQNDDGDDQQDNPFDVDNMKDKDNENEEESKEDEQKEDQRAQQNNEIDTSDEEEENADGELKPDGQDDNQEEDKGEPEEEEEIQQIPDKETGEQDPEKAQPDDADAKKEQTEHRESNDKRSEEDRIEAMPDTENKGTSDQVANDKPESKQENELHEQDTGEDKDGVGQAENEKSDSGHQGIAESKDTRANRDQKEQMQKQEKHRQGNTDDDRSLGDPNKSENKRLKTIAEINREDKAENTDATADDNEQEETAEEYQHVKDAKESDKTTLDNATEEQSKKVQHKEDEKEQDQKPPSEEEEGSDELMDVEDPTENKQENVQDLLESEENEKKKDKPGKKDESKRDNLNVVENIEVEGDIVETAHVGRGNETTAHTLMDILNDMTLPEEPTASETLDMRKMVEKETLAVNAAQPDHDDFDRWQKISNRMLPNARELCEQLRLILEPTKCTRLKGDYRTGRRINMKKIIPYIASQFRKDKIWLRRTKAAQRDYKITIAIDDSKSMDHNNSKELTLQAISLVSQALTLLESGRLNVMSFGESPKILLKHSDQLDGAKLINLLNFEQNQSRIAELLDFVRTFNSEDVSSDNSMFENLLLVLSDGRNIYSEGEKKVKNSVKLARLQRIFVVYVIIDNPENKHSVMDIRVPLFTADRNEIVMQSYLDVFPFPYYVIVRDLGQLPLVLSDAMRQWFELVNSEQ
ncbi:midasin [Wyeomyia smithii]|uniref:midasin n=1 Tax=Wyeomyia smithii TaxID=174621 RepID=UPI002467C490|nr:midasin [Wyeomyia smithii]